MTNDENTPPTPGGIATAVFTGLFLVAAPILGFVHQSWTPVWIGACLVVGLSLLVNAVFNGIDRRKYDSTEAVEQRAAREEWLRAANAVNRNNRTEGPTTHA